MEMDLTASVRWKCFVVVIMSCFSRWVRRFGLSFWLISMKRYYSIRNTSERTVTFLLQIFQLTVIWFYFKCSSSINNSFLTSKEKSMIDFTFQNMHYQTPTNATTLHTCVLTMLRVSTHLVLTSANVLMDSLEMDWTVLVSSNAVKLVEDDSNSSW